MEGAREEGLDMESRTLAWTTVALTLVATAALGAPQERGQRPGPLERVGDPPAPATKAAPAVSPATRLRRERFVTVQVNVDAQGMNIVGDAANEPSLAVDPLDPTRMAIGWRQFDTTTSNFRQAGVAFSADGGNRWTSVGPLDAGVFRSDPVLASDASGVFHYYSLGIPGGQYLCDLFRSTDGGQTWSGPTPARGGDKAWITADRSGGAGDGHLYAEWSLFASCCGNAVFARSTDGGATWPGPITVPGTPIWGTLAVATDGALYVAGRDPNAAGFLVGKSTDAQLAGSAPSFDFVRSVSLGGNLASGGEPNPGGLLGQAWVATDPTDTQTVYLLCSVDPPGPDPLDVRFARSIDGGQTWSASVRVNDDPAGTNAWQWFGTMSVAPGGRIDVVFNDTRDSGQGNVSRLYYTSSSDGGQTWATNEAVSPPFDSHLGWPNQDKLGDYYHMVSEAGVAHLAWAATFNGEQDVYYTRITP
jgi:hypothetical protein